MRGQGNILGSIDPPSPPPSSDRENLHAVNTKWTNFKFMSM